MSLSERQRQLQRRAKSEQQQWQQQVDETHESMRLVNPVMILVAVLSGGAAGHLYFDHDTIPAQIEDLFSIFNDSLAFLIITISVGLPMLVFGAVFKRRLEEARVSSQRRTQQTIGVVVDHHVSFDSMDDTERLGRSLVLEIDFEVDGQPYRATIQPSPMYSSFVGSLDRQRERHPLGGEVEIAYNPANPNDCGQSGDHRFTGLGSRLASLSLYVGIAAISAFVANLGWVLYAVVKTIP